MIFDILYWVGVYLSLGFFLNLVVANVYKNELIGFVFSSGFKDIKEKKITEDELAAAMDVLDKKFFIFSIVFSLMGCPVFFISLLPALFGKNPFPPIKS